MSVSVSIVCLGRAGALGEVRRVESWSQILAAAGVTPHVHRLMVDHRAPRHHPGISQLSAFAQRRTAPESLAWSLPSLRRALPPDDTVICVTARAYHPALSQRKHKLILDLVDDLSASYRQRAALESNLFRSVGLRLLAASHNRLQTAGEGVLGRVAAGWGDAERLGAVWVPNVVSLRAPIDREPDVDVVFFGSLSYAPNIAAVEALAGMWPEVERRRPGTTALIAGAAPVESVRQHARQHGWQLHVGYRSVEEVCARGRVAVAPLRHTAGIQNKVLEAAALGVPQVISPEAARGLDPGFPIEVAGIGQPFVNRVLALLDDRGRRARAGEQARQHVAQHYAATAWTARVMGMLDDSGDTVRAEPS